MARNFEELRQSMTLEKQASAREKAKGLITNLPLDELRAARAMTQVDLAAILGVQQVAIAKIENKTDMYLSTLTKFIRAMSGDFEIRAVFPEGTVRISSFGEAAERTRSLKPLDSIAHGGKHFPHLLLSFSISISGEGASR